MQLANYVALTMLTMQLLDHAYCIILAVLLSDYAALTILTMQLLDYATFIILTMQF